MSIPKKEVKKRVSIRLRPSTRAKAERMGLNLSKLLEELILALPEK